MFFLTNRKFQQLNTQNFSQWETNELLFFLHVSTASTLVHIHFKMSTCQMWIFSFWLFCFSLSSLRTTTQFLGFHFRFYYLRTSLSPLQRAETPAVAGFPASLTEVAFPTGDAAGPEGRRDAARRRDDVQPAGQPGCHHLQLLLQRHGRNRRLHGLHGRRQQPAGPLLRVVQPGPQLHQHTCGQRRLPGR